MTKEEFVLELHLLGFTSADYTDELYYYVDKLTVVIKGEHYKFNIKMHDHSETYRVECSTYSKAMEFVMKELSDDL